MQWERGSKRRREIKVKEKKEKKRRQRREDEEVRNERCRDGRQVRIHLRKR